jgi:hypothetical protein
MPTVCGALAGVLAVGLAGHALAWGATGHRIIGRLAMQALRADAPAFLRAPEAARAEGELSREPDRWKGAGRTHDSDRDPAHFLNMGDDGAIMGGPKLAALPETREGYETALRAVGSDSWKAGYLPYSIIDGYQQVVIDLAYWRVDRAGARMARTPARRAWFAADAREREALTLRDIGALGHYVGDGSQPMHVSMHFNGWGSYPNPEGFTQAKVHGPFEGAFVRDHVAEASVRARMKSPFDCHCSMWRRVEAYLAITNREVVAFYRLEKTGAFASADPHGVAFAAERLAAGADELRDLIEIAWRASEAGEVGYPPVSVADVEAGKVDPYDALFGID